jgi:hypothetical protein
LKSKKKSHSPDSYEDYVDRVILYKQQVWTCKYTGRKNLSYMSALSSEQKHVERIYFSEFPKYILYPMIKILNESKSTMLSPLQTPMKIVK